MLALAVGILVVAGLLVGAPQRLPAAQAAVPATCTPANTAIACVQLYVGDYRETDTDLVPLPGALFGLFASNPEAVLDANDGYADPTPENPPLFTCTSDVDGDCVFQVPVRAGAVDATGVPQGTRLWMAALCPVPGAVDCAGPPWNHYANPFWQTAPLANTSHVSIRHVFQTPPLVGGQLYESGRNWITAPGLQTDPPYNGMGAVPEFTRRIASGGVVPLSRYNLDMPPQCGLNVAFIVDVSSSVGQAGAVGALTDAMDVFVDALHGTPSQIALFTLGTDSPANGFGPNSPLMPVGTAAEAGAFKALYSGWDGMSPWPTNYTNWDRGLAAAAAVNGPVGSATHVDLAVMLTDGNPTVYGPDPVSGFGPTDPQSGYTRFREIGNGVLSANLLKSQGTRLLALGVGSGVAVRPGSDYNLRSVSGRDLYDPEGGAGILEADYFIGDDYAAAGDALHDLVLASCAPSVSVVKRILPTGSTDVTQASLPGQPWEFTVSDLSAGSVTTANPGQTAPETGTVAFDLDFTEEDSPVSLTVSETDQGGYTPVPSLTTCRNISTEEEFTPTVDGTGTANVFTIEGDHALTLLDAVSCVVYNQAPPGVVPADVVVHKQWVVNGTAHQEGTQPSGLQAALQLSGPDTTALTDQTWSEPRAGYNVGTDGTPASSTVSVAEDVEVGDTFPDLAGCTVTDRRIRSGPLDPGDTTGVSVPTGTLLSEAPLVGGTNEWTVTNEVECTSTLTLVKQVANGPLASQPQLWDLAALGPDGALPGPGGSSGSAEVTEVPVTPGVPYQLAERIPDPAPDHYMFHYAQNDLRSRPLLYPESSGSWDCRPLDNPSGDPSLGIEGAVVVPLGEDYECVAVNTTALATVAKTVLPEGAADPADFVFRLTANPPILIPDPQVHEFPAGQDQSLVPNQHYTLDELLRPSFTLTALTCESAGEAVDPADLVLLPGATATCAATNQLGDWTATKTSVPATGSEVAPGDVVDYTVTAYQIAAGGTSTGVVVTDDLSGVLDDATLVDGSIVASMATVERSGTSLVWRIDTLTDTAELRFQVRVDDDAWGVSLDNVLTRSGGQDCATVVDAPGPFTDACDETHHPTQDPPTPVAPPAPAPAAPPAPPSDAGLAATGVALAGWLVPGGLGALALGTVMVLTARARTRRR